MDGLRRLFRTPLHRAAAAGDLKAVQSELANGSNPNSLERGISPLLAAISGGQYDVARELLKSGANPNRECTTTSGERRFVLHGACSAGNIDAVRLLLQHGARPELLGFVDGLEAGDRGTALHACACSGNSTILSLLCASFPTLVDCQSHLGWTPVMAAAGSDSVSCLRSLADAGASLHMEGGSSLKRRTAMDIARLRNSVRASAWIQEEMLRRSAEAAARRRTDRSLLAAAKTDDASFLTAQAAVGIDLARVRTPGGYTLAHVAARHGSVQVLRALIDAGISLQPTAHGSTPLHVAAESGNAEAAALLVSHVDAKLLNDEGLTASGLARRKGFKVLARQLGAAEVAARLDGEDGERKYAEDEDEEEGEEGGVDDGEEGGEGGGWGREKSEEEMEEEQDLTPLEDGEDAVRLWLRKLRLESWADKLIEEGFDDLRRLGCIEERDLDAIGMRTGHKRLLLMSAAPLRPSHLSSAAPGSSVLSSNNAASSASPSTLSQTRASTPRASSSAATIHMEPSRSAETTAAEDEKRPRTESVGPGDIRVPVIDVTELRYVDGGKCIGEGSFGVVRRAQWRGMDVAVKILRATRVDEEEQDHYQDIVEERLPKKDAIPSLRAPSGDALDDIDLELEWELEWAGEDNELADDEDDDDIVGEDEADEDTAGKKRKSSVSEQRNSRKAEALERTRQELLREASTMSKVCNHAHVIEFVGIILKPRPALVTRFMPKGSVESLLVKPGPNRRRLPLPQIIRMAADAAAGMVHLHLTGLVHRDLAARNLLVDEHMRVRVSDFGFSRVKAAGRSKGYTRHSVGPIKWLAPEAFMRSYSDKSDVFSFGVTLWEMLTGSSPWEGVEPFDVILRVYHGERLPIPDNIPLRLRRLMQRAFDANPDRRPSMSHIHAELESFLADSKSMRSPIRTPPTPTDDESIPRVRSSASSVGSPGKSSRERRKRPNQRVVREIQLDRSSLRLRKKQPPPPIRPKEHPTDDPAHFPKLG